MRFTILAVLIFISALARPSRAQTPDRLQAGIHFTGLHINQIGEGPAGVGGRLSCDLLGQTSVLAVEAEFNYFPQNPSGNFGESQFLAGAKAGFRADRLGVFAKLRPGFIRFAGADFAERNGTSTPFALDAGAVIEYAFSRRVAARLDIGDTMIYFPDPVFTGASPAPRGAGLKHNLQSSLGLMFRF